MSKKMLIDASHPEETRVAVMQNGKVEDFDFESLSRKPLRGNIYLARITRVEPSLQAAFVDYGGNRHGFLAFNEIHPDYYQIPVSDREVLRKAEALEAELAEALSAYETEVDEPDLDEDDEGLRTVDTEVPEETHDPDEDGPAAIAQAAADNQEEEEEEEEERAPEDGGSDDGGSEDGGDTPPDYAGEAGAEEAGWHAIEEEEIAALPPREAREHATDDEREAAPDAAADAAAVEAASDEAVSAAVPSEGDEDDAATAAAAGTEDGDDEEKKAKPRRRRRRGGRGRRKSDKDDEASEAAGEASDDEDEKPAKARARKDEDDADEDDAPARKPRAEKQEDPRAKEIAELERRYEDAKRERAKLLKNYRIQEVIKRRQIMLVQAVKEERGNKGAALTTYLSLAGRYGVLMPNTARGGGVSRKITNTADRKRLRTAMKDMEIPAGMGLIVRTAGAKRTKSEIKRDYDYLSRLWETIRDDTLRSVAPCLIYEEASLIKRAIRDLYDKDTEVVTVEGEEGYREAKDFMKMLMPSHAKNVQPYRDSMPLFHKFHVESQIDEMFTPTVKLPSGGYLVIQQTEALVSIDVNSGKSTKERNVEQTALKTNMEAAEEVARQCKLRDLAGLVVIDFIDMDERKNNRAVEKALKEAMKTDRARIQLGSISDFGLLEFSRQRKRAGIVDGTTRLCPLCEGAGHVRSVEMAAMRVLRGIEDEAIKGKAGMLTATAAMDVALHVLNTKRDWLNRIEAAYGVSVVVNGDAHKNGDQYDLQMSGEPRAQESLRQAPRQELATLDDEPRAEKAPANDDEAVKAKPAKDAETTDEDAADAQKGADASAEEDGEDKPKKRRRRGRRGGRRNRRDKDEAETASGDDGDGEVEAEQGRKEAASNGEPEGDEAGREPAAEPKHEREAEPVAAQQAAEPDAKDLSEDGEAVAESYEEVDPRDAEPAAAEAPSETERRAEGADEASEPSRDLGPVVIRDASEKAEDTKEGPKRGGWWQRALGR